jgi:hypothetical protein
VLFTREKVLLVSNLTRNVRLAPKDHAHIDAALGRAIQHIKQAASLPGHAKFFFKERHCDPDRMARRFDGLANSGKRRPAINQRTNAIPLANWIRGILRGGDVCGFVRNQFVLTS